MTPMGRGEGRSVVKALRFERSVPRFAAAFVAGSLSPGAGARAGPLTLVEIPEPGIPGPGWHRVRPRLSGICGSDLATVDGRSSRYFEPIVSFPFVPGHEVVGDLEGGGRVVLEPVLSCVVRGIEPCPGCASGNPQLCERLTAGCLRPGLQTGYCADTGGGWSTTLVAHQSQCHAVPEELSDEAAVMVEPAACAVHAALRARIPDGALVVVMGAGTLGLCVVAALRSLVRPGTLVSAAKHPDQAVLAGELGADMVVAPSELARSVRRATRTLAVGKRLAGGADVVIDCVGTGRSIGQALSIARPGGRVVLAGMPGVERVDLAPLWQREVDLVGAYAYGEELLPGGRGSPDNPDGTTGAVRTFELAFDLVGRAELGRLVSARYPLEGYREALAHAATAGKRGSVKVVFDLRRERERRG